MAEYTLPEEKHERGLGLWARVNAWVRSNPVVVKELRGRMRGKRAFILLTVYLLIMTVVVSLTYVLYVASMNAAGPIGSVNTRQLIGKVVFGVVAGMQLLSLTFIAPALTSGAISAEREHQTFDLLRATLLPARALVMGKFLSALVFMFLLLFAALPLQSMAFLLGGVAPEEVLISILLLVVTAVYFCAVGLFFSSFMKNTLASTVLAYAFPILLVFGLPMLAALFSSFFGVLFSGANTSAGISPVGQQILIQLGWFVVSINPIATMIATEVLLMDQHTLWFYHQTIGNGAAVTLISPWILYTGLHLGLSGLLLLFSTLFTRRRSR